MKYILKMKNIIETSVSIIDYKLDIDEWKSSYSGIENYKQALFSDIIFCNYLLKFICSEYTDTDYLITSNIRDIKAIARKHSNRFKFSTGKYKSIYEGSFIRSLNNVFCYTDFESELNKDRIKYIKPIALELNKVPYIQERSRHKKWNETSEQVFCYFPKLKLLFNEGILSKEELCMFAFYIPSLLNMLSVLRDKLSIEEPFIDYKKLINQNRIPECLNTAEAREIFIKATDSGFMTENYEWIGTNYQLAYFAEIASERLNLKHKWKPFQELFNKDNLAQTRRESKERFGTVDKAGDIDRIFS